MLGIVGHEAAKFNPITERLARAAIREAIAQYKPESVCSGECPLGGVDIWAREETQAIGLPFIPYAPKFNDWERGFKPRNLQIAAADLVVCIVVRELPATYRGRRFDGCYHCAKYGNPNPPHIKSGGCWTAWKCARHEWRII